MKKDKLQDEDSLIDIHCHILPDIDDGSPDIETSIRMLEIASADGITHIAATPHYVCNEKPSPEDIMLRTKMLKEKIEELGIRIKLLTGADIRLTYELIDALKNKQIPTINNSRYFLLELPDIIPPNLENFIFLSKTNGLLPIITHPERNYSFLSAPEKASKLKELGVLFQLTALSLNGGFGKRIKKLSLEFIKNGTADLIASDAHNTEFRHPGLSEAYRHISKVFGEKKAEMLFLQNPLAVTENRDLF